MQAILEPLHSSMKSESESELGLQMHADMKNRENQNREYNPQAKYLDRRTAIVDWMCEISDELKADPNFPFHSSTVAVAVAYFDRVCGSTDYPPCKLPLVAICCISIASKFEEAEQNVPNADWLLQEIMCKNCPSEIVSMIQENGDNAGYSATEFQCMEIQLLQKMNWSLTAVTPLHFLGYYRSQGMLFADDVIRCGQHSRTVAAYMHSLHTRSSAEGKECDSSFTPPCRMWSWAEFFADTCIRQYNFVAYPPSLLAAAIIIASRKALKVTPPWRPELKHLTGLDVKDISLCVNHVWSYYLESFPPDSDDSQCDDSAVGDKHSVVSVDDNQCAFSAIGSGYDDFLTKHDDGVDAETDSETGGSNEFDSSDFMDVDLEEGIAGVSAAIATDGHESTAKRENRTAGQQAYATVVIDVPRMHNKTAD